jgi:HEPN domain-containing protein
MLTKVELKALANQRLAEAKVLLVAGLWSGAYYLSGYAVELALKAVLAGRFVADAIPDKKLVNDIYTHNLADLVRHAGLEPALNKRKADLPFAANWEVAKAWKEDARYQDWTEGQAKNMIDALADPTSGVLTWIQANW